MDRPGAAASVCGSGVALAAGSCIAGCSGDDEQATTTTSTIARHDDDDLAAHATTASCPSAPSCPEPGRARRFGEPMIAAVAQAVDQINVAGGVLGQQVDLKVVDESAGTGLDELLADGRRRDRRSGVVDRRAVATRRRRQPG